MAFVTESCRGCQRLLADIEHSTAPPDDLVLVAHRPTGPFSTALESVGVPVVRDEDGRLWEEASITATPLLVRLDRSGRIKRKDLSHDVAAWDEVA